ncbi:sensor domain-containing diguanylate cyclase [Novosphingobium taihuense]|uniref:diguanylate cyclase n=1 Tax=Novosphingobium taihuense TaxID=260085 RepID=A0A7W7AGY9_9SPHN|nr:diguanylate cyclase [Novosphingobium taihuense]MBB4615867.1 diguanylate cyclase (GGDEF)-like protein [Novosphingobium taihuense]
MFAGILPATAGAQDVRPERTCHADADVGETWAEVDARPERWRCDNGGWSLSADAVLLRFELGQAESRVLPQSVVTHTGNFERIDVGVVEANGKARWFSSWPGDVHHLATGPYMVVPVPGVTSDTRAVVVRVVRPWSKTTLSEMRLDPFPEGTGWPLQRIVAMAAICGMLLVPLLINTAFYSVLPERYVIWHLVMVASMLVQAAFATGFFHVMIGFHASWEWQASNLAFSTMAGAALMFAATFIEADALSPRLRRLATRTGPAVWAVGIVCCIPVEAVRPWSAPAMHVSIGAVIIVLAAMLWDARRRGSESVRLQIVAWTPIMAIGSWRIVAYLVPALRPTEAIELYQLALALEVLVTALGIVSRFVAVRQERDRATAWALELEGVADRDPLTGLRNRRTIEKRFEILFERGFRTMAVIDLDHFKLVNDTHGHSTGDIVLRAAAGALIDDRDTKAIRMGGEEFLLMLRGADAAARAERCRRAITTRITAEVPGLEHIVTASMGLVEHDTRGNLHIDFASLYARCDQLLYEAKRLGRNRTMREKVTGFEPAGREVA